MDKLIIILPSLSIITTFLIGIVIFLNNSKKIENIIFFLMICFLTLWMFFNFIEDISSLSQNINILVKLDFFFAPLASYFFYLFVQVFPKKKWHSLSERVLIFIMVFLLMVMPFADALFIQAVEFRNGSQIVFSNIIYIYGLILTIVLLSAFYNILIVYKREAGIEKKQTYYLLVGSLILILSVLISNLILPYIFPAYPLISRFGFLGIIIFVVMCSYAILKHHLFDIKVILTESAVVLIIVALLIQIFVAESTGQRVFSAVLLLIVAYGSYLLIKSVKQEIGRREVMERLAKEREEALKEVDKKNKNLTALQKLSDIVLDNIEMKPMVQKIIDTIPKEVPVCMGVLVALVDKEKKELRAYAITKMETLDNIREVLKQGIDEVSHSLEDGENFIISTYKHQVINKGNDIADFLTPSVTKLSSDLVQKYSGMYGFVSVPLSAGDEHFGAVLYGLKVPIEMVNKEDMNMLEAMADEASLAIQRAAAYEELKKANEYLKQLDAIKDEFISVASHELNTPLAAIEGYLSMILEEGMGKVDKTAKEYLTTVYESSKRLAALILDLLNVSRIEQGRIHLLYAEVQIADLIKSVIDELDIRARAKQLYLRFTKPEKELPKTWIDTNRIREVIINLVGNAIKFTDKGGVTINAKANDKFITVTVEDTGVGIKPGDAERLFQKFSQLNREKNEMQGTGLGLYISKNLVELHGGKIWVENHPSSTLGTSPATDDGKGAKFCFTLPIVDKEPYDPYEGEGEVLKQSIKQMSKDNAQGKGDLAHQVPKT